MEILKQPDQNDLDENLSDHSISKRLANLKEMPHKEYDDKAWLNAIDKRTEQEKANDLMKRYMTEASIDESVENTAEDALKDIERRLNALKGGSDNTKPQTSNQHDDNTNEHEDENTLAKKIAGKVSLLEKCSMFADKIKNY